MRFEQYFALAELDSDKETIAGPLYPDVFNHILVEGVLQFTPETACRWAGPFYRNVAQFYISDTRLGKYPPGLKNLEAGAKYASDYLKKLILNTPPMKSVERQKEWVKTVESDLKKVQELDVFLIHAYCESGTQEFPYRFHVWGTDNTSYSKWFRTFEEAENLLLMLEACEPLDYHKDFQPFQWVFMN
jgi:hypothetical protein